VIYAFAAQPKLLIIWFVRRFVTSVVCLAFAASLHASVPAAAAPQSRFNPSSASALLDQARTKQKLPLTAAPADNLSFYIEFYGTEQLPGKAERKGGVLHWFTSIVKKTAQRVNFFP
jgi:hypothetical protein